MLLNTCCIHNLETRLIWILTLHIKSERRLLRGRGRELKRQQEHPDLSTLIDYVLFRFHCFGVQSGQVFY